LLAGSPASSPTRPTACSSRESATKEDEAVVREIVTAAPHVRGIGEVLTMHVGPQDVILALKVAFDPDLPVQVVEDGSQRAGAADPGQAPEDDEDLRRARLAGPRGDVATEAA